MKRDTSPGTPKSSGDCRGDPSTDVYGLDPVSHAGTKSTNWSPPLKSELALVWICDETARAEPGTLPRWFGAFEDERPSW